MKTSILRDKSIAFAIRIVRLSQKLQSEKKEFVLSKQILRSGTSIGANIHEAQFGQSKPDFINKLSLSVKETYETEYWLIILKETSYIEENEFQSLVTDCIELKAILIASIKTAKDSLSKK